MISVDGASLLAQVLPVGLILIAIDGRSVVNIRAVSKKYRPVRWIILWLCVVAGLMATGAVMTCVISVASNVPVSGFNAVFVGIAGLVMVGAVAATVGDLLGQAVLDATGQARSRNE